MITISVHEPLSVSTRKIDNFTSAILAYTHEIAADGGYWSARIRLDVPRDDISAWYENGLDRRIVVRSPDGIVIWEGFVNTIKWQQGRRTRTIGSVLNIANRVSAVYSLINSSGVDTGLRMQTAVANNLISQDRYGILERVLSVGTATTAEAEQYRDEYLAENAQPAKSGEWGPNNDRASLELDCAGYARRLETYTYTNTATGLSNLSIKLAAVLNADPNSILTGTNAQIEANTLQVPVYDNNNRTAWNVIKSLTAQGDSAFARAIFGVYAGRQSQYRTVQNQADYRQTLADFGKRVQSPGGAVIEPWYVLPGRWLQMSDTIIGRIADTDDFRDDPRMVFLEGVHFTAPYSLSLRGGKFDTMAQKMARWGLAGIGG